MREKSRLMGPPESIAQYRIVSKLGEGGMGEVWRATDTKLGRSVAIKILPQSFAADADRLARFQREAQVLASLNHPHIVTIYDIGSDASTHFLAMEYVPGMTLAQTIGGRPLAVQEAILFGVQIAGALSAAHRARIVHRDLKPGNIMVAAQQQVKVLDFGLAKLLEPPAAGSSATQTLEQPQAALTKAGHIVGTVDYMSPEQLTGGDVDARGDIFAFGIVLYEMLTGRRPFGGSSAMETVAKIIKDEPKSPGEVVEGIPRALDRIVARCLRKKPEERFQSIADVGLLLEDVREDLASGDRTAQRPRKVAARPHYAFLACAAALAFAAAFLGWRLARTAPSDPPPVLTRLTFDAGLTMNPAVSPDGKLLAYASDRGGRGNLAIWVRQLAGGEPVQVTHDEADASEPDFSSDATKIVYRSSRAGGGIYITSSLGGGEPHLVAAAGHAPKFSPDGKWITYYTGDMFSLTGRPMRSRLFLTNLVSGQARQIEPQLATAFHAIWSPDSQHILFSGSGVGNVGTPTDWYVTPVAGTKAMPTGAVGVLSRQGLSEVIPCVWSAAGEVIFAANLGGTRNIWQLRLSSSDWKAIPPVKRLTSGTGLESEAALVSVVPSRSLVFSVLSSRINIWDLHLDAATGHPSGDGVRLTDDEGAAGGPDLTADGNLLLFSSDRSGNPEVWSKDLRAGKETLLTSDGAFAAMPAVAPDGSKFAYHTVGGREIYAATIGGVATPLASRRKLVTSDGRPYSWSPDGEWLFYAEKTARWGVEAIHAASGRKYVVFQHPGYDLTYFRVSPNGRWAVASAFEEPASRVQVAPFREERAIRPEEWITIVEDAAQEDRPTWSSDGTLVYYTSFRDGFRCIWAQRLDKNTMRPSGPPVAVYHSHSARFSVRNAGLLYLQIAAAREKLVFNMGELRGNIWMARFPD